MADDDEDEEWTDHPLEAPAKGDDGEVNWGLIWLHQRRQGVLAPRPIFTGDVFHGVHVVGDPPESTADIVILQHPCALRTDGNKLRPVLVAARIVDSEKPTAPDWSGNYDFMPVVVLQSNPPRYQAVSFDQTVLVESSKLKFTKRVACMKMAGISLLLQRWTHMNTRVVVPTHRFGQVTALQVAEADGIEDWCQERQRARVKPDEAAAEATAWLDGVNEETGIVRRELLENPKARKGLIRTMATVARAMTDERLAEREAERTRRTDAASTEEQLPAADPGDSAGDAERPS